MTQLTGSTRFVPEAFCTFRHQLYRDHDVTAAFLPHQGQPSSERQILDLAKSFSSADQINLYFIQITVKIRQFCGIDKKLFFLLFSDKCINKTVSKIIFNFYTIRSTGCFTQ
jgi:hypothetical protein